MSAADLIAATTLECAGWLAPDARSRARRTHDKLVNIVRSTTSRGGAWDVLRRLVLNRLNKESAQVLREVPDAIAAIAASGAQYLKTLDTFEGRIEQHCMFHELPFIDFIQSFYRGMPHVRSMPAAQQMLLIRSLANSALLNRTVLHLRFASEDGADPRERSSLRKAIKGLRSRESRFKTQMSDAARIAAHRSITAFGEIRLDEFLPLVEVLHSAKAEDLCLVADSLDSAGDHLIQFLQISDRSSESQRQAASEAWATLNELREVLHVLALWMRGLISVGTAQVEVCNLCYRYIDSGASKFCLAHRRTSRRRVPARQRHISERYFSELKYLADSDAGLQSAIHRAGVVDWQEAEAGQKFLAHDFPARLVRPACILWCALRSSYPAIGPELEQDVESLVGELLIHACAPFRDSSLMRATDSIGQRIAQEHSVRWLTWGTFFKAWYARTYPAPAEKRPTLVGRAFDPAHPIAQGLEYSPRSVVRDLLRQRAWTRAAHYVEDVAYPSIAKLLELRDRGLSNRAIARAVGLSETTVRRFFVRYKYEQVQRKRARVVGNWRALIGKH